VREFRILVLVIILFGFLPPVARADVVPGDVINSGNYQKIDGLVPDYILDWVKKGELIMKIGKLNCDPTGMWPPQVKENWKANTIRYKIGDKNTIMDTSTGKPAQHIKGLPFPEPDPKDPNFVAMLQWNDKYVDNSIKGPSTISVNWVGVTRKGFEKDIRIENNMMAGDDNSPYDLLVSAATKYPLSMAGTNALAMYCIDPAKESMRFIYSPDLRKIRRMALRMPGSDPLLGMDSGGDDFWNGGSRDDMTVNEYRFIEEKDGLVPYISANPEKLVRLPDGSLKGGFAATGHKLIIGYEDKSWKGAPWHYTNIIWVKTKVYVYDVKVNDRNYNYGTCQGWTEKGTFVPSYKRITDKNGKFWKGSYYCGVPFSTADGKWQIMAKYGSVMVDPRRDHGSCYPDIWREGGAAIFENKSLNKAVFTRGGFEKNAQ